MQPAAQRYGRADAAQLGFASTTTRGATAQQNAAVSAGAAAPAPPSAIHSKDADLLRELTAAVKELRDAVSGVAQAQVACTQAVQGNAESMTLLRDALQLAVRPASAPVSAPASAPVSAPADESAAEPAADNGGADVDAYTLHLDARDANA